MGEKHSTEPGVCVDCGTATAPNYEHCDECLRLAAQARYRAERKPRRVPTNEQMIELIRGGGEA